MNLRTYSLCAVCEPSFRSDPPDTVVSIGSELPLRPTILPFFLRTLIVCKQCGWESAQTKSRYIEVSPALIIIRETL